MNDITQVGATNLTSLRSQLLGGTVAAPTTRIVAHRGFHDNASGPYENSLTAMKNGIAAGFDMVETDVYRTKDNVLVLHHDATIGDKDTPKIAELNYAELPLLPDGQKIPTLDELLDVKKAAASPTKLDIEIKEGGYEKQILDTIQAKLSNDQFEIISFERPSIEAIEKLDPTVRTGLLAPRIWDWFTKSALFPATVWMMDRVGAHITLKSAAKVGADYVSVDYRMATDSFLKDAAKQGVKVDVWTINDVPTMQKFLGKGVQGLVTNAPDVARTLRDGQLASAPESAA